MFDSVVSTTTPDAWKTKVREEANISDADVILIQTNEWTYPNLKSAEADVLRNAWPQIKTDIQKVLSARGFSVLKVETITQRPVAITANPLSGLVTFIFADVS
jgi:hypothetical protein